MKTIIVSHAQHLNVIFVLAGFTTTVKLKYLGSTMALHQIASVRGSGTFVHSVLKITPKE